MNKKISITMMLLLLLLPAAAQEKSDTIYEFRFKPRKDMFYAPWKGNEEVLARLLECIGRHKAGILDGRLPLYVDGYCNSLTGEADNLATARIRSNRVKTELIRRGGVTEACFVTRNHATGGDYVTVRLTVEEAQEEKADTPRPIPGRKPGPVTEEAEQAEPADGGQVAEAETPGRQEAKDAAATEETPVAAEDAAAAEEMPVAAEEAAVAETPADASAMPAAEAVQTADGTRPAYSLALRANLLRWATLTPDLGVEWRICPSWGIAVNGSWTSWSWKDKDRRYALWEVMPEVRYYIGKEKRGYLGAMFKTGEFNYKLSGMGKQGDLIGGGITGGYQLRLNKALDLDFNLGLGYLNADYERYEVIDGVRVHRSNGTKDWWGPINAGVTLVWKLF